MLRDAFRKNENGQSEVAIVAPSSSEKKREWQAAGGKGEAGLREYVTPNTA